MKQMPILILLLSVFLLASFAGCNWGPALPPTPTHTPQPTPEPACPSSAFYATKEGILGIRSVRVDTIAGGIYYEALNAHALNNQAQLSVNRGQALYLLAYETWRWSQFVDKPVGDGKLRIIATFISPEFIRAITLNEVISKNITLANNNLSEYTNQVLKDADDRNELLFVITVEFESPSMAAIQIDMPVKNIVIKRMDDSRTEAASPNSIFHKPLNMTTEHHTSVVYFPIEVRGKKGGCQPVLDTLHDELISLFIENLKINGQDEGEINLSIPFVPRLVIASGIPAPGAGMTVPPEQYSPAIAPPPLQDVGTKNEFTSLSPEELKYWQDLGRFIWNKMGADK